MSGMLGRAPVNVPALGMQAEVLLSVEGSKRFCKAWAGRVDLLAEPTSVLDIRSPSPSSTLSSSVAASSETGVQGSTESGGVVAVSKRAYESSEGQLVDCTSLLEGGNENGSVWSLESVKHGGAGHGTLVPWQASSHDMQREWERNVAGQNENCRQHGEVTPALIKDAAPGYVACGNGGSPVNSRYAQVLSTPEVKQEMSFGEEGLCKADRLFLLSSVLTVPPKDASYKIVSKREAPGDETLEACVLSCRKREREDSLGEVVQRLCVGGQKIEAGEWLSDWTEFGVSATTESVVEAKMAPPAGQSGDLDDIFSGTPMVAAPEFWSNENPPLMLQQQQQQASKHGFSEVLEAGSVSYLNNPLSSSKVQLDLFEAVQAGLLFKGSSNGGSGFSNSVASSPRPANISPSIQVLPRSFPAPVTSPLYQSFSRGRSPSLPPFQRHLFGDSAPRAPAFFPEFLSSKLHPPAPPLLNATFAPAPPHFASQVQMQDLTFPWPSSSRKGGPKLQGMFLGYDSSKTADLVDQKPLQLLVNGGDSPSKVIPGGPKWQLKPEPGWPQVEHAGGCRLSPHSLSQAERAPLHQVTGAEHVGRCVRLEELSLAERLLCAASESARLGDLTSAQAILTRLNQQTSPNGQQQLLPARRAALLFGEALSKWVAAASPSPTLYPSQQPPLSNSTLDLINKISALKKFCEISPISQFSHFTTNQAILDAMEGEDFVHVVDFELGLGGQWASFMQEIAQRSRGPPELKITAIGRDTLDVRLVTENLLQFAKEVGMKVEVNVVPGQKLEVLKAVAANKSEKEAMAINFGFGMNRLMAEFSSSMDEVLGFLRMVKGLSPKVVAVVDWECEFEGPSGFMDALQFYSCVFESLESSTKLSSEVVRNIESLVFVPKIADLVNGKLSHKTPSENGLPPWRILLQKVGFTSLPFSIAAESQASWLVKNPLNNGFTYLKQHATLLLAWYSRTLVSTSAWV